MSFIEFGKTERQTSKIPFSSFRTVEKGMILRNMAVSKVIIVVALAAIFSVGLLAGQALNLGLIPAGESPTVIVTASSTTPATEIASSSTTTTTTSSSSSSSVSSTTLSTTTTATAQGSLGDLTPPQIFKNVEGSVVSISVTLPSGGAQGSGFVFDNKGDIVTNNHVVEGATSIDVTFLNGDTVTAKLVGRDAYADLAVVQVDTSSRKLTPVPLGDSDKLQVGDQILAIGNPFGLSGSMSEGIVSQLGRETQGTGGYMLINLIQIDAVVDPGNSGGPLLNMRGEVVGVNTMILSQSGGFEGVGLSIPSYTVKRVAASLIATGQYKHPYLGVQGTDVTPQIASAMKLSQTKGFLLMQVLQGGPADKAGLKGGTSQTTIAGQTAVLGGDVIIGVDNTNVRKLSDLSLYVERNKSPGDTVVLKIIRDGKEMSVNLVLGERPQPTG
ncbi:MAG: S1C family serine protease [Thaumarchaeota archaeon]|nr:S1C family serine protease [Nitrososphaerota archaeon]